jgi:hypothetical protein
MSLAAAGIIYATVLVVMMLVARDGVVGRLDAIAGWIAEKLTVHKRPAIPSTQDRLAGPAADRQYQT